MKNETNNDKKKKKKDLEEGGKYLGVLDMLSIPPATTIWLVPSWMVWAAIMVAFIPEEHTLLIVVQTTVSGIPAPKAACLAGAWPKLALRTFPKKTSWTSCGSILDRCKAPINIDR